MLDPMISPESIKQASTDTLDIPAALGILEAFGRMMHYITDMSLALYLEFFVVSILLLLLAQILLQTLTQGHKTSLEKIPGPWSARYTRLWLLQAYSSRSFHKTNLDLHRKYG